MGGRGASSSNNTRVSASEREAYERYVQERLNSKEYMKANNPGLFSIRYPEEFAKNFRNEQKEQSEKVKVAKQIATELGYSEANYRQFLRNTSVEGYSRTEGKEYTLEELRKQLKNIRKR